MKKSDCKFTTADELARETIVNEINTNLFIEAGAGSGKTTMLVNRIIAMIEKGCDIRKICAITFTKNAALEFYERLQAKLIERSNPNFKEPDNFNAGDLDVPTEITRERCEKALANIDLCFMGTIDSFCNMILSEHPTEANIPSDASLISNEEAIEIYKQFYIDAREGKYGQNIKNAIDKYSILYSNPEDIFAKLMAVVMDRRNVDFDQPHTYTDQSFNEVFGKLRKDLIKALNAFDHDLTLLSIPLKEGDERETDEVFRSNRSKLVKSWEYDFSGVVRSLEALKGLSYAKSTSELGLDSVGVVRDNNGSTTLTVADAESSGGLLHIFEEYKYQNTINLLLMCIKPLEEKMRKMGKFTFFDYLYYLKEMLVEDSRNGGKLIDYIYKRHSYFLIDEFQDTNPMQAEVFFYLAAENPNKPSWRDCIPRPGSLFIVGDPKQSIYRFRSADVSSYLKIKRIFENPEVGKVRHLVNNFRSKSVMKKFFNDVFSEVMPEATDEQSEYEKIENLDKPSELDGEFKGIYTYESYSDKLIKEYPDKADDICIAKIIKTIVRNPNLKLSYKDPDGNWSLREITYKDIMLIFAGKTKMAKYISTFNNEKIPVRVEGKVLFEDSDALKTIYSIFKALTIRNDNIALVAALKSPVFGIVENDLTKYKNEGNKINIDFEKDYKESVKIENALMRLREIAKEINNLTPSTLYEKIIDDYEIFKYVPSKNLEIVYYTLELIRNEEKAATTITYEDTVLYLENLLSGNSEQERCLALRNNIDAVHLANVHKVKGLEAPIVILAKAGVNFSKKPDIRIEYNGNTTNGYIFSYGEKGKYYKSFQTNKYDGVGGLKEKEVNSLNKEDDRLVYVAATRSRNVLIVCDHKGKGRGNTLQRSGKRNKWHDLVSHASYDIFEFVSENNNYQEPKEEVVNADELYSQVKISKVQNKKTYIYKTPSKLVGENESKNSSKITNEGTAETYNTNKNTYSTMIGTMVHRLMEMMIMSNDSISKDQLVNNIIEEYLTVEFKNKEELMREALNDIYDTMHNGGYKQINGCVNDILAELENAEEKISEVPFSYKEGSDLWNGIIDLLYRKDGKWHIVDWKTNKSNKGLAEHCKEQLEAYIKACKETSGIDVDDAKIYHIKINNQ